MTVATLCQAGFSPRKHHGNRRFSPFSARASFYIFEIHFKRRRTTIFWSGQPEIAVKLVWLYALSPLAVPWKQDWLLQGLEMMNAAALAQPIRMFAFAAGVVILVRSDTDILYVGLVEIAAATLMTVYYLARIIHAGRMI